MTIPRSIVPDRRRASAAPTSEVVTAGTSVLVEIKEFTPNSEDREQARSMRECGEAGGVFDGPRIRGD